MINWLFSSNCTTDRVAEWLRNAIGNGEGLCGRVNVRGRSRSDCHVKGVTNNTGGKISISWSC